MTVFANNLEVSCKAQDNKVVAAFPDVCMTPPENPATPPGIPVPYPNFSFDSDTDKGTGTVKVGDTTVNLKNKSFFSKSSGDEAGAAAKKGVISSKNTGKAYSQAYSMDVKAEGKNITRFSDVQTDNHGSPPNVMPWPKIGAPHVPVDGDPCASDKQKRADACQGKTKEEACAEAGLDKSVTEIYIGKSTEYFSADSAAGSTPIGAATGTPDEHFRDVQIWHDKWNEAQASPCLAASRCELAPYEPSNCCNGQTGHHLVFDSAFPASGGADLTAVRKSTYKKGAAPCICAEGWTHNKGSHGAMHTEVKAAIIEKTGPVGGGPVTKTRLDFKDGSHTSERSLTYGEFKEASLDSVAKVFPMSMCSRACLEAQLDDYHKSELGVEDDDPLNATIGAGFGDDPRGVAQQYNQDRYDAQMRNNAVGLDGMVNTCPFTGAPV